MSILTAIVDVISAVSRLLEAEGRILRRALMRLGWALAFAAIASLLLLAAAGFLLLSAYQFLASRITPEGASLAVCLLALLFAMIFAAAARSRASGPR